MVHPAAAEIEAVAFREVLPLEHHIPDEMVVVDDREWANDKECQSGDREKRGKFDESRGEC